ncbi:hypothetical protein PHAVU_006G140600 [Phaseolus vulgaris]|uniref:DUF4408 domain-containing protein n=1 Tax=Phaseolus vulgaris TaxID=3885 RepID=V7BSS4_PHAVU|nr:hypothetical protein PHAVU_006G140600g [Phaseolus vulgaris]ESW19621.1 hypothetical protein PHAVU_006G140600g [Phaseolus vulgaris]
MDQSQRKDQVLMGYFNNKQFLKRTLQFVLSVSVFSVFVWYSSGFSIHPQSFNAYFSTCLFSMFTHTLERKYMFLICNGILAFVAKTALVNSSDSDFDKLLPSNLSETKTTTVSDMVVAPLVEGFASPENVCLVVEEQKGPEEYSEEVYEDQEQNTLCTKTEGRESGGYITEEEIEEGESDSEVEVAVDDELAEATTTTNNEELLNTDELNRKFEEFIRKMKEEIRIEAQRQLIAV